MMKRVATTSAVRAAFLKKVVNKSNDYAARAGLDASINLICSTVADSVLDKILIAKIPD